MKKRLIFLMTCVTLVAGAFAQDSQVNTQVQSTPVKKNSQASMQNEMYLGYGALGAYYFFGRVAHSDDFPTELSYYQGEHITTKFTEPASVGTFYLGYQRSLSKIVSVGMVFGYQAFTYTGTGTASAVSGGSGNVYGIACTDNLITGSARFTFCYLSKPVIRMYSGVAIGLTIDFGKATINGEQFTERKLFPGGQLTLMGLRFGRAFGGFLEFGFGSYGIINAGLSYKFAD